jgi:hypothetical protein
MASERQIAANRANALRSTGPRTREGKLAVAGNGLRHGILARGAVLPGVEHAEDWESHQRGVVASLRPAGLLELRLAERVAELLWRLGRVARYESLIAAVRLEVPADLLHCKSTVFCGIVQAGPIESPANQKKGLSRMDNEDRWQ